jgi:pimeloyl-ACP methyl ester carboxylesterase
MVEAFIETEQLKDTVLICHSFGGRVALDLAARRPDLVGRLVLMGSAGIRPKRKASYYVKLYSFKAVRLLAKVPGFTWLLSDFLQQYPQKYGSSDYQKASEVMRRTLSSVVNEDLTPVLKDIAAPTLLIWGDKDTATPVEHARIMEAAIPGARVPGGGLVVYEGFGHYAFLQKAPETLKAIRHFLGQEVTHS